MRAMKACLVSTTPTADREGRTQVDDGRQSTGTARRLSHGGAGIAHATADAVQVVRLAPLDFDLDCRVADSESSLDVIHHGAQHLLAFPDALFCHDDVTAARDYAGPYRPDVQIVHVQHTADLSNGVDYRRHIGACGRSFEKYGDALAENAPTGPHNQSRDQKRDDRIHNRGVRGKDDSTGGDHSERGHGVADHMQVGASHIHVVLRTLEEPQADHRVQYHRDGSHRDHETATWQFRMANAAECLPDDHAGDHDEGHGINQGGEDTDTVVAVRHPMMRRPVCCRERVPTERESSGVREVVASICEQSQAVTPPAVHCFDKHEGHSQSDRGGHRATRHRNWHVRVSVRVPVRLFVETGVSVMVNVWSHAAL